MSINYYKEQIFSLERDLSDNLRKYSKTQPSLDENALLNIDNELDMLNKNIENDLNKKTLENKELNKKLESIYKKNIKLDKILNELKGENSGSLQMFQDAKLIYNQQLIATWILIILLTGTGYTFLKKK